MHFGPGTLGFFERAGWRGVLLPLSWPSQCSEVNLEVARRRFLPKLSPLILFYSILLYSVLVYSSLLYSTPLHSTLFYSILLYSALLYPTVLYSTLP